MQTAFDPIPYLEKEQLASERERPLPRRKLGRGVLALLIALRVYVAVALPLVIYAFVHALLSP